MLKEILFVYQTSHEEIKCKKVLRLRGCITDIAQAEEIIVYMKKNAESTELPRHV